MGFGGEKRVFIRCNAGCCSPGCYCDIFLDFSIAMLRWIRNATLRNPCGMSMGFALEPQLEIKF